MAHEKTENPRRTSRMNLTMGPADAIMTHRDELSENIAFNKSYPPSPAFRRKT